MRIAEHQRRATPGRSSRPRSAVRARGCRCDRRAIRTAAAWRRRGTGTSRRRARPGPRSGPSGARRNATTTGPMLLKMSIARWPAVTARKGPTRRRGPGHPGALEHGFNPDVERARSPSTRSRRAAQCSTRAHGAHPAPLLIACGREHALSPSRSTTCARPPRGSRPGRTARRCSPRRASTASLGAQLWFKCENLQRAGAFKFRGAMNAVSTLTDGGARARRRHPLLGQPRRRAGARGPAPRRAIVHRHAAHRARGEEARGRRLRRPDLVLRSHARGARDDARSACWPRPARSRSIRTTIPTSSPARAPRRSSCSRTCPTSTR